MHSGGDPGRLSLGVLCDGALINLVDCAVPQGEPAHEMLCCQRGLLMKATVRVESVASVEPCPE